jgi:hypothetical protein
LATKLHTCKATRAKQSPEADLGVSCVSSESFGKGPLLSRYSLPHTPHPSAFGGHPLPQGEREEKRRIRHLLLAHTTIMTGFSISSLNAPISSAPSAPSTAR